MAPNGVNPVKEECVEVVAVLKMPTASIMATKTIGRGFILFIIGNILSHGYHGFLMSANHEMAKNRILYS